MCRNFGRKIDGWLARTLRMTTNSIYAVPAAHCDLGPAYVNNPRKPAARTNTKNTSRMGKMIDGKTIEKRIVLPSMILPSTDRMTETKHLRFVSFQLTS